MVRVELQGALQVFECFAPAARFINMKLAESEMCLVNIGFDFDHRFESGDRTIEISSLTYEYSADLVVRLPVIGVELGGLFKLMERFVFA